MDFVSFQDLVHDLVYESWNFFIIRELNSWKSETFSLIVETFPLVVETLTLVVNQTRGNLKTRIVNLNFYQVLDTWRFEKNIRAYTLTQLEIIGVVLMCSSTEVGCYIGILSEFGSFGIFSNSFCVMALLEGKVRFTSQCSLKTT